MEGDDFKTAVEGALQFFPLIKLKRTGIMRRKPACQTERRPRSFTDWLRKESYLPASSKSVIPVLV